MMHQTTQSTLSTMTIVNDTFNQSMEDHFYTLQILGSYFYYSMLITVCGGIPANFFILGCSVHFSRLQTSRVTPLLYHYFILSITAADLIFLIFYAGPIFLQNNFQIDLSEEYPVFCRVTIFSTHLATVASSTSLLCLNIDKWVGITKPLHYATIMTKKRAAAAIGLCWTVAITWTCSFTFGPWTHYDEKCGVKVPVDAYIAFSVLFFIAPIFTAGVLSSIIAVVAFKAIHQGGKFKTAQIATTEQRRVNGKNGVGKLGFVFSTTLWSCLSCLPYRIWYILMNYQTAPRTDTQQILMVCFYSFMLSHPAGNAVVTFATQKRYRLLLINMICHRLLRRQRTISESTNARRSVGTNMGRTGTTVTVSGKSTSVVAMKTV